ncbi:MAG TPA: CPBP family intramembrane glutamic endopeptidase [Roseiflexaceae bacterium]|nr:CPBP family intramembrane glutamic endopeptidase [Roseiflexaceae bacterium]
MHTVRSLIQRHPLMIFVALAYLLSWWPMPTRGVLVPAGPMLAALIVVGLAEGRSGLKTWWGRVVRRSGGLGWYLLAAVLPGVLALTAAGLNILLGARAPEQIDWIQPFIVWPIMILAGGMLEEPGWTGYALPRLLDRFKALRYGTLIATLIMGAIRIGWHVPLMLSGQVYWSDIPLILAAQIVIVWLFNRTGGSVLAIMLLHLMNNTFAGEFVSQFFTGADSVRHAWILTVVWGLLAVGAIVATGLKLGRSRSTPSNEQLAPALS